MASVEHCLYCFETLAAELQGRQPMSLYQVMNSWQEYPKGLDSDSGSESEEVTDSTPATSTPSSASTSATPAPSSRPSLTRPSLSSRSIARVTTNRSRTASPSASHLAPPNEGYSTPEPERSFTPVGIGRKTSQRSTTITESPLFVTWNKQSSSSGHYNLRGCIGTFEAQPLASGLSSYALTSALQDTRFRPVTLAELPKLEVAVTLLTDFEPCSDPMDWVLGVHGLRISFYYRSRRLGATYLPDVAVEQGWTKEECMVSLMKKAGWNGKSEKWREVSDLKVVRYQGKKESVEWEEYKDWRAWVDKA